MQKTTCVDENYQTDYQIFAKINKNFRHFLLALLKKAVLLQCQKRLD
jgi:hypothetical protein